MLFSKLRRHLDFISLFVRHVVRKLRRVEHVLYLPPASICLLKSSNYHVGFSNLLRRHLFFFFFLISAFLSADMTAARPTAHGLSTTFWLKIQIVLKVRLIRTCTFKSFRLSLTWFLVFLRFFLFSFSAVTSSRLGFSHGLGFRYC